MGCVDGSFRNLPFCRESLPIQYRVRDLIGRLTLQEKIGLLVNNAAPVPRLGIRSYEWWSEALHGVSNTGRGVKFGGRFAAATSFPQVISTAASFNASLWEQIGRVVSDEARAMHNGGAAGLTYWSPNVNIFRDPRWGRGQETPGEDPKVVADYGVRYVRGLQGTGAPGSNRLKVAACCKHYTAYDVDNWEGVDRFHFNARVSKQDLADTFNVPFQQCVARGKVACVMCSYNQVNGKPTCADPDLLRGTLRNQWRLNGYIASDCDSVDVLYNIQRYTKTPEDAAAQTLRAGLDLDCGPFLSVHTGAAIQQGKVKEADVNWALTNTLTVQMRLGLYDSPSSSPFGRLGPRDVCTAAHKELALEAARQGSVLLQNRGRSLPLSMRHHRTVAVIGPNSDATATMIGNYAGVPCGYTTPVQGIGRYARTIHQKGCASVACPGNRLFGAAEAAARGADATVLVMGLDQSIEAEFRDRTSLLLPGHQQELVSRVARASRGPTILVLMSGGPIDVTFAKNDPRISAIVWVGYPGQAGGAAIADVIFGAHNPGGKLPMTWYPQSYVERLAMTRMDMRASRGYPGRTYRFYRGPVVFPFGFGLSYTAFAHSLASEPPSDLSVPLLAAAHHVSPAGNANSSASPASASASLMGSRSNNMDRIRVSHASCDNLSIGLHVHVRNTGGTDGSHTVLLFVTPPPTISQEGRRGGVGGEPTKQLVDYRKVHLAAGTRQRVRFQLHVCKHLSIADQFGIRRIPIGNHTLHIGDVEHTISIQTSTINIP